jgi:type VI secretion system protein ImpG
MKSDLLTYYERELVFIRQMAAQFAEKYPDRAGGLKLNGQRSDDPHVERLIEAFALIAGRIHRKIDDEFPEITAALLDLLYPHYLRPIPAMSIVQFQLDPEQSKVEGGYVAPRDSKLYSQPVNGAVCHFKTCYPVRLWPIEVASAGFLRSSNTPGGLAGVDAAYALRIELRTVGGASFAQLGLDQLRFYLAGDPQAAHILYELLFNNVVRIVARNPARRPQPPVPLSSPIRIEEVGFARDEGMLPYSDRSFLGYRMLQEYFSFPQKFLFFDLRHLDRVSLAGFTDRLEILILIKEFDRKDRAALLEQSVTAGAFELGCTPVVNLFERCAEPIRVSHTQTEYRVIPDIRYPAATEVYSVDRVTSVAPYPQIPQEYRPFYSFRHADDGARELFWIASRRASEREGDGGAEVYVSLVDSGFEPQAPPVESLTVHVTCTNRDLPARLPITRVFGELEMESGAVLRIRFLETPTPAIRPPMRRGLQWRLISHLGLNYLSIVQGGREALQELLKLYDFSDDPAIARQIAGVARIESRSRIARVASDNGLAFCAGLQVDAEFDEEQYVGGGVFLMGSILERFLGLYSAINSFSQLRVTTLQRRGVLKEWPPRAGEQILL